MGSKNKTQALGNSMSLNNLEKKVLLQRNYANNCNKSMHKMNLRSKISQNAQNGNVDLLPNKKQNFFSEEKHTHKMNLRNRLSTKNPNSQAYLISQVFGKENIQSSCAPIKKKERFINENETVHKMKLRSNLSPNENDEFNLLEKTNDKINKNLKLNHEKYKESCQKLINDSKLKDKFISSSSKIEYSQLHEKFKFLPKSNHKRKSKIVDVYDIMQDEDFSNDTPRPIAKKKAVKKCQTSYDAKKHFFPSSRLKAMKIKNANKKQPLIVKSKFKPFIHMLDKNNLEQNICENANISGSISYPEEISKHSSLKSNIDDKMINKDSFNKLCANNFDFDNDTNLNKNQPVPFYDELNPIINLVNKSNMDQYIFEKSKTSHTVSCIGKNEECELLEENMVDEDKFTYANSFGFDDLEKQIFEQDNRFTPFVEDNISKITSINALNNYTCNHHANDLNVYEINKSFLTSTPGKCYPRESKTNLSLSYNHFNSSAEKEMPSPIKQIKTHDLESINMTKNKSKPLETEIFIDKVISPNQENLNKSSLNPAASTCSEIHLSKLNIKSQNIDSCQLAIEEQLLSPQYVSPTKSISNNDLEDIVLFESPIKHSSRDLKSKKHVMTNMDKLQSCMDTFLVEKKVLFPETDLEETVLKPKKSYTSPSNFKSSLLKEKKRVPKSYKAKTNTKFDKLAAKLNQEFDEIENMELCIE